MEESACPDDEDSDLPLQNENAEVGSKSVDSDWIAAPLSAHEGKLIRYAERICGDLDRAREVVQETFLRLCNQDPERFSSEQPSYLTKWLFTVCRNLVIDDLRREKKMTTLTSESANQLASQVDNDKAPDQQAEQAETEKHVSQLIDGLPINQQEVIRLKFQNGLSYKEIAEVTGHTVTNVGFMLHTAIKKLRERIQVCAD